MIDGTPFLKGDPDFLRETVFDLHPDEQVIEIGKRNKNGNVTSAHRVDKWTMPLTYMGTIELEEGKWMAFRIPREGVTSVKTGLPAEENIFKLYLILNDTLFVPHHRRNAALIFEPGFKKIGCIKVCPNPTCSEVAINCNKKETHCRNCGSGMVEVNETTFQKKFSSFPHLIVDYSFPL